MLHFLLVVVILHLLLMMYAIKGIFDRVNIIIFFHFKKA